MLTTVRHIFGRIMHSETALHSQWDKGQKNNLLFASPSIRRPTRSQIGPSFFLYMDVSDIRTPFLVDRVRPKITSKNIFLIIRNAAMVGMMIVFLYYDGAQPLLRHMSLHPLNTAGCTVIIQRVAYFDGSMPLF